MEVKALKERPRLTPWIIEYWEGFQVLGSSRKTHQGGIGPIPLSEIAVYMDTMAIRDIDERLKFIRMIQSLDRIYVKHINAKAKSEADRRRRSVKKPIRKSR